MWYDDEGIEHENHPEDWEGTWDYDNMPDYDKYDDKEQFEEDYEKWYEDQNPPMF